MTSVVGVFLQAEGTKGYKKGSDPFLALFLALLLPGFLGSSKQFAKHWRTPIEKMGDTERGMESKGVRPLFELEEKILARNIKKGSDPFLSY